MTPPVSGAARVTREPVSPYRLQLSGGYTSLDLGNGAPTYSGGQFQAQVGQAFHLHPQHALFLNGVFRLGSLSTGQPNEDLSLVHFGLEGGYEVWPAPEILSLFAYAGLGTNVLYSQNAGVGPGITRTLDNQSMVALTLGGGFTLGRGIFYFAGGWQPNFGLQVPAESEGTPARGFNPSLWFLQAGLDLARLADWAGATFPRGVSFGEWARGITPGFYLDTSYTYNFGQPAGGVSPNRVFQERWDRPQLNYMEFTLDRAVDEQHPFGFRMDLGIGENARGSRARSSFSGEFASGSGGSFGYDLQQLYARLRIPVGRGLTFRGGKFVTPIGNEYLESLTNNHMSHSFQFLYAIPFTHLGLLAEYPFSDQVTATAGIVNGWDNVLDRSAGIAGLGALSVNWAPQFTTAVAGTVGNEGGRLRSILDFIATVRPTDGLSLVANYDWGHEGEGAGMPGANWHGFSLTSRYDFQVPSICQEGDERCLGIAARGEVVDDTNGVRTGADQTLYGFTGTLHYRPRRWMHLRAEARHDRSSAPSFLSGAAPVDNQTTIGLQAGLMF